MKSGFTLIETLVAFSVLTLMFLGPITLISKSISFAIVSQNNITAFYLGQEAVEYILNLRDTNLLKGQDWLYGMQQCYQGAAICIVDIPNDKITSCGVPCKKEVKYDDGGAYYNHENGPMTGFIRMITIDTPVGGNSDEAKIKVEVTWTERTGEDKSYTLEREMFNWK